MKNFRLIEKTKIWFSISAVLILVSLVAIFARGLNFGIDFVGGTIVTIDLHTTFDSDDAREITDQYDKSADITYSGDAQDNIIISTKEDLDTDQRAELFEAFQDKYDLDDTDLVSVDTVSGTIGSETTRSAIIASLVAIALMMVYITFRFEYYFGIAAVVALLHDVVIVIGVYALFQIQVNSPFIAAVLTILGYSINDTIVVFDRIRENESKYMMPTLEKLVDTSVLQTLKRSIYTVVTTLIAITALYIFGVSEIRSFTLPLIVGITSGCYSSIFIAGPLWVIFQKKFQNSDWNKGVRKKAKRSGKRTKKVNKKSNHSDIQV